MPDAGETSATGFDRPALDSAGDDARAVCGGGVSGEHRKVIAAGGVGFADQHDPAGGVDGVGGVGAPTTAR